MTTEAISTTQLISILGMFASILAILRWFKIDTAEMIKIYADSTTAQIEAIREDVKSIQTDVKAIQAEVRDFHQKLCEIQQGKERE